jgi:hypothetical protein
LRRRIAARIDYRLDDYACLDRVARSAPTVVIVGENDETPRRQCGKSV